MASDNQHIADLEKNWDALRIEDEELHGLGFNASTSCENQFDARWCIVGKLLSNRAMDFNALHNVLAALRRLVKEMFVNELELNR